MKIMVTGISGLVGAAFAKKAAEDGHEIYGVFQNQPVTFGKSVHTRSLDLTQVEMMRSYVRDTHPDIIVNAAALSSPAEVEARPERAHAMNVILPRELALLAREGEARLIHLSTDMVFDGVKGSYRPTDSPAPSSLYGRQKQKAEQAILEVAADSAEILRITIVTGNSPGGQRSVHEKLFGQWQRGNIASLYTDEIRQPCSADNVAEVILASCAHLPLTGIYHWAGADALSRYEMGQRIIEHFGMSADLIAPVTCADDSRPSNLTFDLQPLISLLKINPTPFSEQLAKMKVPPHCQSWYDNRQKI